MLLGNSIFFFPEVSQFECSVRSWLCWVKRYSVLVQLFLYWTRNKLYHSVILQ